MSWPDPRVSAEYLALEDFGWLHRAWLSMDGDLWRPACRTPSSPVSKTLAEALDKLKRPDPSISVFLAHINKLPPYTDGFLYNLLGSRRARSIRKRKHLDTVKEVDTYSTYQEHVRWTLVKFKVERGPFFLGFGISAWTSPADPLELLGMIK